MEVTRLQRSVKGKRCNEPCVRSWTNIATKDFCGLPMNSSKREFQLDVGHLDGVGSFESRSILDDLLLVRLIFNFSTKAHLHDNSPTWFKM